MLITFRVNSLIFNINDIYQHSNVDNFAEICKVLKLTHIVKYLRNPNFQALFFDKKSGEICNVDKTSDWAF
jgi:hypothetical protein